MPHTKVLRLRQMVTLPHRVLNARDGCPSIASTGFYFRADGTFVQAATVIVAPPILNSRTQISNSPFGRHISSTAFFYTVRITLSEICF